MKGILCAFAVFVAMRLDVSARTSRLSLADWTSYSFREPAGPGTYAFGYDVDDAESNNVQFRDEERHPNGTVTGSYGYVDPDGTVRIVHYVADENGYRVTEENNLHLSMLKPIIANPESPYVISARTHQYSHDQFISPWYRQGHPGYRRFYLHNYH